MLIRCKLTRRFLIDIDIESYLENLRRIGIKQEIPLKITLPCPRCHQVETYEIYENRYIFIGNEKLSKNVSKKNL